MLNIEIYIITFWNLKFMNLRNSGIYRFEKFKTRNVEFKEIGEKRLEVQI